MNDNKKSKPNLFLTLVLGLFATSILYNSITQYLIDTDSWMDETVTVNAYVDDIIVKKVSMGLGTNKFYDIGIPLLKYDVNGKLFEKKMESWSWSLDKEVPSTNPVRSKGDSVTIKVNLYDPLTVIPEGSDSTDFTSIFGFIIWGGLGSLMMYYTLRRLKRRFSD